MYDPDKHVIGRLDKVNEEEIEIDTLRVKGMFCVVHHPLTVQVHSSPIAEIPNLGSAEACEQESFSKTHNPLGSNRSRLSAAIR